MKRLHTHSQNFLRNPRFAAELIGHTSIKKTDTVYDIGAGSGVLTSQLARRAQKVIAVEVEPATAAILRKNMADYDNVTIIEDDILAINLPAQPYKVFANIPFALSSAIVSRLTSSSNPPEAAYLIVQKQFANKLLPSHAGFSSQLGMLIGPWFSIRIRKSLRRTDFWPHPNVDTVLLEIKKRDQPLIAPADKRRYQKFIQTNFTTPAQFSKLPLRRISANTSVRPSSLTLEQWLILFKD